MNTHPHPAFYAGDFNSHEWGYEANDENGEKLVDWAANNELCLVHDAKDLPTFYSRAHRKGYNPDLCFVSADSEGFPIQVSKTVMPSFPSSQHRPVIYDVCIQIPIVTSVPRPRWNFRKVDWHQYSEKLDTAIRFIPPLANNYDRFTRLVISTAKKCIPRGYRKEYDPCWNEDTDRLYEEFCETEDPSIAREMLKSLDEARRARWIETVESIDMTKSSRKGWAVIRKLGAANRLNHRGQTIKAEKIANRIVHTSKAPTDVKFSKKIHRKYRTARRLSPRFSHLSRAFTLDEINLAILSMKNGKASGADCIYPEFLTYSGPRTRTWLAKFYSNIVATNKLPTAFKITKIIALLKHGKKHDKPENYRPIALLSTAFKLLERLLFNRIAPIIGKVVPKEQAAYTKGRSCADQVLSLTNFIETGFQLNLKTVAVFIDLSAAYDTVWKKGLMYKLLKTVPCLQICELICNMLSERQFMVLINDEKSRIRKLNNGLPQGSVPSTLLFNLYVSDLPPSLSRKFLYADDMTYAVQHKCFNAINQALTNDMEAFVNYCKRWRLIPNKTKTVVSCFHLNNQAAYHKLNVLFDGKILDHDHEPTYLGVKMNRPLTYKQHAEKVAGKLITRNGLIDNQ